MKEKLVVDGEKRVVEKLLGRRKAKKGYEYEVQWVNGTEVRRGPGLGWVGTSGRGRLGGRRRAVLPAAPAARSSCWLRAPTGARPAPPPDLLALSRLAGGGRLHQAGQRD